MRVGNLTHAPGTTMTDPSTSLYAGWFKAMPEVFRAMAPPDGAGAQPAPTGPSEQVSLPFPADQVSKALDVLDVMLTQFYRAYLPLLATGDLSAGPLKAMVNAGTETFNRLLGAAPRPAGGWPALHDWNALAQFSQPWSSLLRGLVPGDQGSAPGVHPLQVGMERTFGGLSDAFGLGPMRELEQAWREMMVANVAKQRAQLEYLALVAEAWNEGTRQLLQQLNAMGARGERIESLLAVIRLWAKAVDGPLHDAMQTDRGLAVTAKVIRASTQHRQQVQKTIGLASEALHVPTRADVDDAYREIQELKRELRRVKKALPPAVLKKITQAREHEA